MQLVCVHRLCLVKVWGYYKLMSIKTKQKAKEEISVKCGPVIDKGRCARFTLQNNRFVCLSAHGGT